MVLDSHTGGAAALFEASLPADRVGLAWLGQAGFALRYDQLRLLIDPYLSDHLARKYAGTDLPHDRMMPPPVEVEALRDLDLVLCSHRHGDHMDPGSLPVLARNNPACRFVVPRAETEIARQRGLVDERLIPVDDGAVVRVSESFHVHVLPSAHEALETNERGEHRYLGFVIRTPGATVYHSGDTVVFDGLAGRLAAHRVDLALLPVNGRSERLTSRGIAGNMDFDEAIALCQSAGISHLMPHHFGMFAFNTADPEVLRRRISSGDTGGIRCQFPELNRHYLFAPRLS